MDNNRKITVNDYFATQYKRQLRCKDLPCIIPNGNKKNYLPLELCYVVKDQPIPKRHIKPDNTGQMVRKCAQKPDERFAHISNAINNIVNDSRNYLSEFKIEIEKNPLKVPGRVLR